MSTSVTCSVCGEKRCSAREAVKVCQECCKAWLRHSDSEDDVVFLAMQWAARRAVRCQSARLKKLAAKDLARRLEMRRLASADEFHGANDARDHPDED